MNTKFFGQFLLEKSIITQDQLLQALSIQREISPLLGELAVNLGWINMPQSEQINRLQMQQDKLFGDIAVELSLLSQLQVDELLEEQRKRRPYIGEILTELEYLNAEKLQGYLDEHQKSRNVSQRHFDRVIQNCADPNFMHIIAEVFPKIYQRVCKGSIALTSVISCANEMQYEGTFWYQDINIKEKFTYRICMTLPNEHGLHMGRSFIQMPIPNWDELAVDALKEFLNTFTYHVHYHLDTEENNVTFSRPIYAHKRDYRFSEKAPCLVFDTGKYVCHLIIEILPG